MKKKPKKTDRKRSQRRARPRPTLAAPFARPPEGGAQLLTDPTMEAAAHNPHVRPEGGAQLLTDPTMEAAAHNPHVRPGDQGMAQVDVIRGADGFVPAGFRVTMLATGEVTNYVPADAVAAEMQIVKRAAMDAREKGGRLLLEEKDQLREAWRQLAEVKRAYQELLDKLAVQKT